MAYTGCRIPNDIYGELRNTLVLLMSSVVNTETKVLFEYGFRECHF